MISPRVPFSTLRCSLGTVLRDERHPVTLTQPVGDLGQLDLLLAQLAALCA